MQVVTDYVTATNLIHQLHPCFFANYPDNLFQKIDRAYVIGRKYRGLFDDNDGSFVTIIQDPTGYTIDRDAYGAIPLFYSTTKPIVSTDIRLLVETMQPEIDTQALCEYLSTAYLTGGKTIYQNIRCLLPNQVIQLQNNKLTIEKKVIFPETITRNAEELSALLEQAIDHSIQDFLQRFPDKIILNLSGGTDSTLLLAKIKDKSPQQAIITTTYFHSDWRDDLNDWEYAEHAAKQFKTHHHLTNIENNLFTRGHADLVKKGKNIFHTYAAAFYLQNQIGITGLPIVNGSGPDESMIGTEKIEVNALLALQSIPKNEWIDYLIKNIDYIKIPEATVAKLLQNPHRGFTEARKNIAMDLLDASNFVEFQRRYHVMTILQDHIHEITAVSQILGHPIIFPYLTNDIFKIIFSSSFETLNMHGIYKSAMKKILEKYMPKEFVHRKKIGFQSPSRPYFKSQVGLGFELTKLLVEKASDFLNMTLIKNELNARLNLPLDLHRRYDFLEWTAYNFLLLEKLREESCLKISS